MMNWRAASMLKGQPRPAGPGMPMTRPPAPGGGINPLTPMVKPVGSMGHPQMMTPPPAQMGMPRSAPLPQQGGGINPLTPMVKPMGGGMPDWRRTMMGGAGIGMLNPMTLPGMMDQNAPGGGGGGGGGPPPAPPAPPTQPMIPPGAGPVKPAPVQTDSGVNGVMYRMPDGGMFDIYGNTWSPFGQLFGPGNSG
jgi:hypothetical protein